MARETGTALRQKILDMALETVCDRGVAAVTMRTLAERLGYSPATLYLHFGSKDELLQEVARVGDATLVSRLRPVLESANGDAAETLRRTARLYLDFALGEPALYRLMFEPVAGELPPDRAGLRASLWELSREVVARGVEQGAFAARDPGLAALLHWSALHGFALLLLSGRVPAAEAGAGSLEAAREALVDERVAALRA